MAHIRKREDTYSYTVDIGVDPLTGKRKQVSKGGFTRKKDAEAAARKIQIEIDEDRYVKGSNERFHSYINDWYLNHLQTRVKRTTAASIEYILQKHILRENPFSHKEISKITTADIDAFYNLKLSGKYSTSYIRKMHQILSQAFKQAVKWKKITFNPMIEAAPPVINKKRMTVWSMENVQAFLEKAKGERPI